MLFPIKKPLDFFFFLFFLEIYWIQNKKWDGWLQKVQVQRTVILTGKEGLLIMWFKVGVNPEICEK